MGGRAAARCSTCGARLTLLVCLFLRSPQFALLAAGLSYNPDGTVEFHGFNAFEEPAYGPGASNDGGSANMYRQAQVEAYRNSGAVKN
jgi:hypothetical protein